MNYSSHVPHLSRRTLLGASATFTASAFIPRIASAAQARDPRFITIILRGALDGLSAVAPLGDPDYQALRAGIALSSEGDLKALPLDGFFALHPAMPNFARLYAARQAMVVHAVATPYRERSHFDGQDVLESGLGGAGRVDSGWMNRMLQIMPKGERIAQRGALSVGAITPLIMRGASPVLGWSPQKLAKADGDLSDRVLALYQHKDPALASALGRGLDTDRLASRAGMNGKQGNAAGIAQMKEVAAGAARLVAQNDGPRLAALSFGGWDTHANEGGARGRLADLLGGLDLTIAVFEDILGPVWKDTIILVVTEFGRTARVNGTIGTDHGTGTLAFLAGGALKGGRIIADWPGLKQGQLHEGRDLKPTTDLRAIAKGVLAEHLGLPASVLATRIFPDSQGVPPAAGLIL